MTRWYVCDMDDGVLRVEPTRTAAVEWWRRHQGALKVLTRHTYRPGYYEYVVGHTAYDNCGGVAIVREDCLHWYGLDTPPDEIKPVYPYADRPHDPRPAGDADT